MEHSYVPTFWSTQQIWPRKELLRYKVMFDRAWNVQLGIKLLKFNYPTLTVMRGVEHTVLLFFNDVSKIPILHKMIAHHKAIYNIFVSDLYHKPHFIFELKPQDFLNRNIGIFSGNDTRMAVYFVGMHRDLRMWKVLQYSILSAEFSSMTTNSELSKDVRYIHNNKSWDRFYLLLKPIFPCLRVTWLE